MNIALSSAVNAAPIKVVVADDHPIVRSGVSAIMSSDPGIEVVGQTEDSEQTLAIIRDKEVDVLLLDLAMPGEAGLSLLKQVLETSPGLRVVVFSAYGEATHKARSLALGASSYLPKGSAPSEILNAVKQAMLRPLQKRVIVQDKAPHASLSVRQFDIFIRLVNGQSVTDIAKELDLSVKTVSTHKVAVQKRLDAPSSVELVRYAQQYGLIEPRP